MVRPLLSKWTLTKETEGLLVFAEALQEALFDHSPDSYRSPALNLHVSLLEVWTLLSECVENGIHSRALDHAIDELREHLYRDPVAPKPLPLDWKECLDRLANQQAAADARLPVADALLIRVGEMYWKNLLGGIEEAVQNPQQKARITQLARAFSTEVQQHGFSRDYTYWETRSFFFDTEKPPSHIEETTQIREFLGRFSRVERRREVVMRGEKTYLDHVERGKLLRLDIGRVLPETVHADLKRVGDFLDSNHDYPAFIVARDILAKDEFGARNIAIARVEKLRDLARFGVHDAALDYLEEYVILDEAGHVDKLGGKKNPMLCGTKERSLAGLSGWHSGIEILAGGHATTGLRRAVDRLMEYHESALAARTHENQLLNLWAALEGFLIRAPERRSRVEVVANTVLRSLALRYAHDLLEHFSSDLSRIAAGRRTIKRLFNEHPSSDNVAKLLVCAEHEQELASLFADLDEFPLLRFRLFSFNRAWSSSSRALAEVLRHKDRCEKHIYRIYNTRNLVMHSASSLPYLPALVQDLHSYLDLTAESVISVATAYEAPTSLAGAIKLLEVQFQSYLRFLRSSSGATTTSNYRKILAFDTPLNDF